jgi:hypothetical protein
VQCWAPCPIRPSGEISDAASHPLGADQVNVLLLFLGCVTFESGSRLERIDDDREEEPSDVDELKTIEIPSSVPFVGVSRFDPQLNQ